MQGAVFWFFGLSGAGKSTVAGALVERLRASGRGAVIIDGDQLRRTVCRDLGYSEQDRLENVRRAARLAREHCERGAIVLVALMTPQRLMRRAAADLLAGWPFYPMHLACDYSTCAARDEKGLYRRAEQGRLAQLPGRDLVFEEAGPGEARVDTQHQGLPATLREVELFVRERLPVE
jgi:adenylylsulfate kinase